MTEPISRTVPRQSGSRLSARLNYRPVVSSSRELSVVSCESWVVDDGALGPLRRAVVDDRPTHHRLPTTLG
jgi:hypothetical protein